MSECRLTRVQTSPNPRRHVIPPAGICLRRWLGPLRWSELGGGQDGSPLSPSTSRVEACCGSDGAALEAAMAT